MSLRSQRSRWRVAKLSLALLVGTWELTGSGLAVSQTPSDPEAIAKLKALFALDRSGRGEEIFSQTSPALAANFSPAFIAAWKSAKLHEGKPSSLEGDPLSGQQESNGEKPVRFALEGADAVVVTLTAPGPNVHGGYPVKFKFVDVAGRKLIDDIEYPAALASLSEIADPKVAAELRTYIGSYRKTLDHVTAGPGARP